MFWSKIYKEILKSKQQYRSSCYYSADRRLWNPNHWDRPMGYPVQQRPLLHLALYFISKSSFLYPQHNEVVGSILVSLCLSICLFVRLYIHMYVRPACHVCSTTPTVLDGFLSYQAQMVTRIRVYVTHNDVWSWPIFSRSFSHEFVIKLLKYSSSCRVSSTAPTVLDGFFPYLAKWSLAWEGVSIG